MRRRSFLQGFLTALLSTAAPLPVTAQPAPGPVPARRFIDVHCHFFNAADLPVKGFIRRVVLEDFEPTRSLPTRIAAAPQRVWSGLVATLIDFFLQTPTPTALDELRCLQGGAACRGIEELSVRSSPPPGLSVPQADAAAADRERLAAILSANVEQAPRDPSLAAPLEAGDDRQAFVDFVLEEMKEQGRAPPLASSRSLREDDLARPLVLDSAAGFLFGGLSVFSRYFAWGRLLTSYRTAIVGNYRSLYDPGGDRLFLAAPAIIDFGRWLEDEPASDVAAQIEVMEGVALRQSAPVHGFVPFDPLRELRRSAGEPSALEIVRDAIEHRGFIGVKLYPPMGFRPSANAEAGLAFPSHASLGEGDFGARLDAALGSLYAWCASEDVPIMAHTNDSQSAGEGFGLRAEPRFWRPVLEQYPGLRVNLAHFGNFNAAISGRTADPAKFEQTWEFEIGGLIAGSRFSHVFADVSYFWWVLDGRANDEQVKAVKQLFARYLERFDPELKTLLFGTDWSMTARASAFESYLDNAESFFKDVGLSDAQLDRLFFRNALAFLGLAAGDKTTARLATFYQGQGRPQPAFLSGL
jgi:predicted TIM-barrel fold metal-dependent hydrolase